MKALVLAGVLLVAAVLASSAGVGADAPRVNAQTSYYGTLDEIDIPVAVPKPEAVVISPKMKTKYQPPAPQKGFVKEVLDSVKDKPL